MVPTIPDNAPWSAASFAVIDLEGDGYQPPDLVELAVIPVDAGVAGASRTWLVKPNHKIAWRVTQIHGIKNADVASAPRFESVCTEVLASLEGRYLVAHNAVVDWDVLHRKIPSLHPPAVLDTLRLARALCPGERSYSLSKLLVALGLQDKLDHVPGRAHRAAYDAAAALELFLFLVARTSRGTLSLQELRRLCEVSRDTEDLQGSLF